MNTQPYFRYELIHKSKKSHARVGKVHTPHGIIETPNFVAVGTNAALKALDNHTVNDLGLQLMFCNTYHLMLQPGTELVKQAGGLHTFINRKAPIITDSGGFQVFSLAYGTVHDEIKSRGAKKTEGTVLSTSEDGVVFRSYRDGKKIVLTPESSVQAQKDLGADIIIPFDELPPYHIDPRVLENSLHRTHRWEERSLIEHKKNPNGQAMYAVVHGGVDRRLRNMSINHLSQLDFDGFAVGGSFGKDRQEMIDLFAHVLPQLPKDKPNHLLGIGDITSIEQFISLGVDTFDSSYPTRCARHGLLFTSQGNVRIAQSSNKYDFKPIDPKCTCIVCQKYTRAYIHHLFKAKELTGLALASLHNLHVMIQLMADYRRKILEGEI
jgi:queuine tRNA-ribosyltransferase